MNVSEPPPPFEGGAAAAGTAVTAVLPVAELFEATKSVAVLLTVAVDTCVPAAADYLVVLIVHVEIVARYKAIAGERGYQTLINDTLRRAVEGDHFVQDMRSAIREELATYTIAKKRDFSRVRSLRVLP